MTPGSELLLQAATHQHEDSWLLLGGEADLASGIAAEHPAADIEWQPVDVRESNAMPGSHSTIRVSPADAQGDRVRVVVLPVPPDRGLARRSLLVAHERLVSEGLLLAGANAEGIRSVISDALAVFEAPEFERYGQNSEWQDFDINQAQA